MADFSHPLRDNDKKKQGQDRLGSNTKEDECQDENEIPTSGSSHFTSSATSGVFRDIGYGRLYNSPQPRKAPSLGNRTNFQFHQIPLPNSPRRGSRGNARDLTRGQGHSANANPFIGRFRSQNSIPEYVSVSAAEPHRNGNNEDLFLPHSSPSCWTQQQQGLQGRNSSSNFFQSHPSPGDLNQGATGRQPKPKKWFSFTNLLNRQNLSSLLNLPKSRLSVSSTLNSVFMGPISPLSPSEAETGNTGGGGAGNAFFGVPPISGGRGHVNEAFLNNAVSPSHSCSPGLGYWVTGEPPGQSPVVVYRRKSGSASERSSGAGYYTGHSSTSSAVGGNRLSCGEFFTGTPNSPISCGEREQEFQYRGGQSLSGFSSRCGESYSKDLYFSKTLGRSLPTLLESMESGIASQGSSEGGNHPITLDSVLDLMYQEFAILTGAKSIDDHYILTFPDRGNFHLLGDEEYKRLVIYLTSVPPMHDAESGFVIIIDRRQDKWNSVKTTLVKISNYFPALIHRVVVLRPIGIFQKALSEISSKLFRTENLRLRCNVCNSISDLFAFVEPSQLTIDLGGSIAYDKNKWVQERVEVEHFHIALQSLSRDLKNFTEVFHDLEYPNDVSSTETLICDKHSEFQRLRNDLSQAIQHGEHLLFRIKDMSCATPEQKNGVTNGRLATKNDDKNGKGSKLSSKSNNSSSVQLINVISVERYIIQIEETSRLFEEFWIKEKMSLEQCLQLRRFEQEFREMQANFDAGLKRLEEFGDLGESLQATDLLIADTLAFEISAADDITHAQDLERIGREIVECNQSAVDSVEPKCLELSRMVVQFKSLLNDKISKQKKWRQANQLCNEGLDLISCQITDTEDCTDGVSSCGTAIIARIDELVDKIRSVKEDLTCLKTNSGSSKSEQSKPLIKQVLNRVEDVEIMCMKRRSVIVQMMKCTKSRRSSTSSFASTPSTSSQNSYGAELKSARSTSQLNSLEMEDQSFLSTLRSGSSTLSLDGNGYSGSVTLKDKNLPSTTNNIQRGHILNELMRTEKTYVEELGEIITGYRNMVNCSELKSILPQQLQPTMSTKLERENPNVSVLFCNLGDIFTFHSKILLPDLSNCVESIELVGLCFIQRHSDFLSLYSDYCQLLPASEVLRKEIGENHPWFVTCRNRIGHKLTLGAYLLKPVQRDLIKHSEGCEGVAELKEALECMLIVLKCVNDGMHQLGITGYPGKLIDEGYLILQGSFLLWTDNKKDRLRLKGHTRHLFLYQRSILICKKIPKSTLYEFKSKLSLSEIGLTEVLKGSGASKKFEIWVNGRQKVFLLQAENSETKDIWVGEIKKLLLEQLESIRSSKSKTIAACAAGASSQASISSKIQSIAALRRQKMMHKGVTVNGWRSSNMSHRPLRQVSSWDKPDVISRPESREDEVWSSDASNSDEYDSPTPPSRPLSIGEEPTVYGIGENVEHSPKYLALADYSAAGVAEISLRKGDLVKVLRVGVAGWWFVKIEATGSESASSGEGWAPSAFLRLQKIGEAEANGKSTFKFEMIGNNCLANSETRKHAQGSRSSSISGSSSKCSQKMQQNLSRSTENILSALR